MMPYRLSCFLFVLFFVSPFSPVFSQNKAASNQDSATENLHALFDTEWQRNLEENPTFASYLGDKRYNARWNDQSLAAIKRRRERNAQALSKLKKNQSR